MRCQHCDYLLFNLTQPVCPECGRGFDVETYRFNPSEVSFNCPHCDQEYYGNDAQGLPWPRQFTCIQCGRPVALQQMRVVPRHPDAMGTLRNRSPWDRRREMGLFGAWWETFTMTLFKPGLFYQTHSGTSIKEAWLFSMIASYVGMLPGFFYQILFMWGLGRLATTITPPGGVPGAAMLPLGMITAMYMAMGLTLPLFAPFVVSAFWAGLIQPALWLLAPNRKSIGYTFRTAMYSFGPYALCIVPVCGGYAAWIWQLVTLIIGIKEVHKVSGWQAAIAVLWPVVIGGGLYVVIIVLVIAQALP